MKINKYPRKSLILLSIIFMDLLTGMEFDLLVPSFPKLQNHFMLSPFLVETLLSANFVGYCLSLFFIGGIADRYGNRLIILFGLLIFNLGSLLCLYPDTYPFLIIGRFLQGMGVAAPAILSFLIIVEIYSLKEQQFLMAVLNGAINIAVAISPILGSYITFYFHPRGNFISLFLAGLAALILALFFVPSNNLPSTKLASRSSDYKSIFESKSLILLIINIVFIVTPYWIFVGMSPLLYIKSFNVSLKQFGYYQGSLAFVFAVGSILYGSIIKTIKLDQRKMLILSLKILVVSLVSMMLITYSNCKNPLIITLAFLPFIISQIIPSVILYPISLNFLPQAKASVSSMIQGARLVLTALGLQIAGYFYRGTFQNIGIVIIGFIVIAAITLFFVIKDHALTSFQAPA